LAELQSERYRSLILAVVAIFTKEEKEKFLVTLVSRSVRVLCAGVLAAAWPKRHFARLRLKFEVRGSRLRLTF